MHGVLLVNLGTPNSPSLPDVRRYLTQFLTDARIIDKSWWMRQLLVRGIIVPRRVRQSAKSYQAIWTEQGSPLMVHSQALQKAVAKALGSHYCVELAMRYQNPSLQEGLRRLLAKDPASVTILPLFPQYASATTGSIFEEVMRCLHKRHTFPALRFIRQFPDHEGFIDACTQVATGFDWAIYDEILISFHGLPMQQVVKAHPRCKVVASCCSKESSCYAAQCYRTAAALARSLQLPRYKVVFQSRLGKEPWLSPYAAETIEGLGRQGAKRLAVLSPSFVADCLETIGEYGIEYQELFRHCGGGQIDLVPSLNSHPRWVEAVVELVTSAG